MLKIICFLVVFLVILGEADAGCITRPTTEMRNKIIALNKKCKSLVNDMSHWSDCQRELVTLVRKLQQGGTLDYFEVGMGKLPNGREVRKFWIWKNVRFYTILADDSTMRAIDIVKHEN